LITQPAPSINDALNQLSADHVIDLSEQAASLWRSVTEAAWRGDLRTMEVHCQQIVIVSKEAFRTVKELRESTKVEA
jgi:hypothetical protein